MQDKVLLVGVAVLSVEPHICNKGAQMLPILTISVGQLLPALFHGQVLAKTRLSSAAVRPPEGRSRRTFAADPSNAKARCFAASSSPHRLPCCQPHLGEVWLQWHTSTIV